MSPTVVNRMRSLGLAALLALVSASHAAPPAGQDAELAAPVIEALAGAPCSTEAESRALCARLSALGPAAIPDLFRVFDLTRGPVGGMADTKPSKVRAVLEALGTLPRHDVLSQLELVAAQCEKVRTLESALLVLGTLGTEADLDLVLRLAHAAEARNARGARDALRACLDGLLDRTSAERRILSKAYEEAPDALRPAIVRAAAGRDPEDARDVLAGFLKRSPDVDPLILSELARLDAAGSVERATTLSVRACLHRPNATVAALAAIVCARFEDDEAVLDLIGLLRHDDAAVRGNAHRALKHIARLGFRDDPEPWEAWYATERTWWETEARATLAALPSAPAARAADEIQGLARRRLFRREIAAALAACLEHAEPDVARLACATLGEFGFPESRPALTQALAYPERKVRVAAESALQTIARGHVTPSLRRASPRRAPHRTDTP